MGTPFLPGVLFEDAIPDVRPMAGDRPKTTTGQKAFIALLMGLLGSGIVPTGPAAAPYIATSSVGVRKSREQQRRKEVLRAATSQLYRPGMPG